jgi:hypothetical protein
LSQKQIDLDAIQKACDEATPGPWERRHLKGFFIGDSQVIGPSAPIGGNDWVTELDAKPTGQVLADANFIAAAREWVPALVARVRELELIVKQSCLRVEHGYSCVSDECSCGAAHVLELIGRARGTM